MVKHWLNSRVPFQQSLRVNPQREIAAVPSERNIASVVARSVLRDEAIPSYEETASFLAVTLVS